MSPRAQTTGPRAAGLHGRTAVDTASVTHWRFSGPTGSLALRRSVGSVARMAKRLATTSRPQRHWRAKPIHLQMVGSLFTASAVDGLSMMKAAVL